MTLTVAGIAISDPMAIWRDYSRRTKTLDRYDLAPAGDPGLLRDDEIRRTWIIASRISADQRTRLVIRAATAPWHDVPSDSELAAADPAERDGLFDKAAALYYHFAVPHQRGLGQSKIHKVLHLKRPGLYPVLDRNLVRLYKARAKEWIDVIPGAAAGDSVTYWAAIRSDLTDHHNGAQLAACRAALLNDPETAAMAVLPAVRLLDILAWDAAGKR